MTCFAPNEINELEAALELSGSHIVRSQILNVYKIPPVNTKSRSLADYERLIWFGGGVVAASVAIIGGAWAVKQLAPVPSTP